MLFNMVKKYMQLIHIYTTQKKKLNKLRIANGNESFYINLNQGAKCKYNIYIGK